MTAHMLWWGPGWWIVGSFLWLAFWIAVILVIVGLVRGGRGPATATGSMTPALRVLEERYARGEIDREEFLERRAVLSGDIPPAPPPPAESGRS